MNDATILSIFSMGCGCVIVVFALAMGYDSNLALGAVGALWGGEKVVHKLRKRNRSSEKTQA